MKIYVIRHGETDFNKQRKLQGWKGLPLNKNGIELAQITGKALKGIHFNQAFSSPLERAFQTAQIILSESGNKTTAITTDDRLKEMGFGDWECTVTDNEETRKMFRGDLSYNPGPGKESFYDVMNRTQSFLKELISSGKEGTYLVSTHGCAMRAMLNFLYENPENFWQEHVPYNCAVNIIDVKDGKATLTRRDLIFYDRSKCIDYYK